MLLSSKPVLGWKEVEDVLDLRHLNNLSSKKKEIISFCLGV